jgi:hypothetical protein
LTLSNPGLPETGNLIKPLVWLEMQIKNAKKIDC